MDAIAQASARVRSLVGPGAGSAPSSRPPAASSPPAPAPTVALALELLRQERFTDALDLIAALRPEAEARADLLMLRAVLLMHCGQFAMAERTCQRLLEIDEFNAAAHYVLALCREGTGDHAGAVRHDQIAVYLDPTFAMAHLHMGVLARRAHDTVTAQREFKEAVTLLQREDATRLLLFGGGFSREALVRMCGTDGMEAGQG
jgi:chemotaxis protein methyltransferase CheR